jgi:hypothetical protein
MQATEQPQKKSKLPIIIGVAAAILVCLCVAAIAVYFLSGDSDADPVITNSDVYAGRADELLRSDTMNIIGGYEASQYGCDSVNLVGGEVLVAPAQTGDAWVEQWQVNACDAAHTYKVVFSPSSAGGTDIAVTPVD